MDIGEEEPENAQIVPEEEEERQHVGLRFCQTCNSMLYPKEDKVNKKLMFACRYDNYIEEATGPVVWRQGGTSEQDQLAIVKSDVINDPTLQRSYDADCAKCGGKKAVFFQVHSGSKNMSRLNLIFVCCNPDCCHKWMG